MPRGDRTGPLGAGSMTGRGLGFCADTDTGARKYGDGLRMRLGLACRRGFGRGFGRGFVGNQPSQKSQKELLNEQKTMLQDRLEVIDKQLENL